MTFWPWTSFTGASLAIMIWYESIRTDGFFIWVTVWILWQVRSRLQKTFRGIGTIWSRVLKLNQSSIIVFCELEKVYLGMENVIRSSDHSHGWYFLYWPTHVKFALGLTEQNWSFPVSANEMTLSPRVSWVGASIAIMCCYEYDGINFLSIRVTAWVSWRVETHLQKAFRDVVTIWSRVLKLNQSSIMLFLELEKVYLGMEMMIRSPNPSHDLYFWIWPLHVKFALGLNEQKS